jgi:type II secretory pathway pseudopilin PulG
MNTPTSFRHSGQRGFTYLVLLFSVALSGAALAAVGTWWSQERQRDKEAELLDIGNQFRRAIGNYYERSPGTVKRYPRKLEELVFDTRFLTIQRHLRRVSRDPITGEAKWGVVTAPDGGIMGVHSLSDATPIKSGGFAPRDTDFTGKSRYSEWWFVYYPENRLQRDGR